MFSGYPQTTVTRAAGVPLADDAETSEHGPVMTLEFPAIEKVIIEAHAVLRIVKHARDGGTRIVGGTVTGMQFGTTAEVTSAVPYVQSNDAKDEEEARRDRADHDTLIERYGAAGFDRFPLGRYTCCTHSAQIASRHLNHLEMCVRKGEPSLLVAYDPLRSEMGKLYLKAYTLSDQYLSIVREEMDLAKRPDGEVALEERRKARKMDGSGVLKEVPVEIHANALQQVLLAQLAQKPRGVQNTIIANHDLGRYTERALTVTVDVLEKLRADVSYRQGKHRDDGIAPQRADTHVVAQQLLEQSKHLDAIASGSALNLDFARHVAEKQADQ